MKVDCLLCGIKLKPNAGYILLVTNIMWNKTETKINAGYNILLVTNIYYYEIDFDCKHFPTM